MDDAPDDLTPPGPPVEPAPAQAQRPAPGPAPGPTSGPTAYHPIAAYGAPQPWRELDRASLVGFALALTGVAAPAGVVFGALGLRRTADGTRAGRWAAVLAVVIGLLATVVMVAGIIGLTWFRDNVKGISRVEAGECANLDDSDGLTFFPRDCTERHWVEVVAAGEFDETSSAAFANVRAAEFCFRSVDEHYRRAARTGDYQVNLVVDGNGLTGPQIGDSYACVYTRADGRMLTEPIDDGGGEG